MEDLVELSFDPDKVPNIAILNYSDVLRRFMLNQSVTMADLDQGVQQCVAAKTVCRGFEGQPAPGVQAAQRQLLAGHPRLPQGDPHPGLPLQRPGADEGRRGDLQADRRPAGDPRVREAANPLGPVQSIGNKLLGGWL